MAILDRPVRATFPSPTNLATHDMLQVLHDVGVWSASGSDIVTYASADDQREATGLSGVPLVPGMPNKYWRDNTVVLKPDFDAIYVWVNYDKKLTYKEFVSDMPTSAIFSPGATNFLRSHWTTGLVPQLYIKRMDPTIIKSQQGDFPMAALMNFGEGPHIGYPIAKLLEDPVGGIEFEGKKYMSTLPSDRVLVYEGDVLTVLDWAKWTAPVVAPTSGKPVAGTGKPPKAPATPPTPVAPVSSDIKTYEGMDFDTTNGQAIVNKLETGWYFENTVQALPTPGGNPDVDSSAQAISPWAFATQDTARRVLSMIYDKWQWNGLAVEAEEPNVRFPTNVQQLQIAATDGEKKARVNAGLVASQIARTTAWDAPNKRIVQSPNQSIDGAVADLKRELGLD